ncbi:cytochrome P450 [Mycobacterium xenopi]|uniref:Cytochrome P450 n=1 Tax=Mycobacterium xenopi TaxID=1789 RepID=A0AAD1GYP4_MYCXE|nr:cytochrome P450 [Mycobacterium xenopi]MDA3640571.1 cytochrome P450 [Mycobacterium xenopi]MDA3658019.1 cytochrome P450 [Mycobacterium xenopi]MDA3662599.1 cytochrome P450 [Mycobacterium xenopi]SPX78936.1 cytochrome P450 [Mycobacterium xenopi]BBU21167.1 hypothetical protein MYXE_09560 [Mycobacterium xenopi]
MTDQQPLWQCPVETLELNSPSAPALTHFRQLDAVQDRLRPVFRNAEGDGYWMFTDHAVILDGLQHPELWSSSVIVPTEPDPPYKWIPIMIDPPEHAKWLFPSIVFPKIMGMPVGHLDQFLEWEDKILHQQGVGEQVNAARFEGMQQVMG